MKKFLLLFPPALILFLLTKPALATQYGVLTPGGNSAVLGPSQVNPVFPMGQEVGYLVTLLLPYIFIFAGLAMLIFLIIGGFQLMISGGEPKALKEGQEKITGAIIGFIVIFLAYWIAKILELLFNIKIVS